jgi:hypothetical protein
VKVSGWVVVLVSVCMGQAPGVEGLGVLSKVTASAAAAEVTTAAAADVGRWCGLGLSGCAVAGGQGVKQRGSGDGFRRAV